MEERYRIIRMPTMESLERCVRVAIAEGWQPTGGVAAVMFAGPYQTLEYWTQAMTKDLATPPTTTMTVSATSQQSQE